MRLIVSSPSPDTLGWGSRHAETFPEMTFAARCLRGCLRLLAGRGHRTGRVANGEPWFGHGGRLGGSLDVAFVAFVAWDWRTKEGHPAPVTNPARAFARFVCALRCGSLREARRVFQKVACDSQSGRYRRDPKTRFVLFTGPRRRALSRIDRRAQDQEIASPAFGVFEHPPSWLSLGIFGAQRGMG